jgi:hypothetical protein
MAARAEQKPTSKTEAFVEAALEKARSRVRLLDLVAGSLGLAAAALGFLCAMAVLDQAFVLSATTRLFALLLFLAAAGFYAWYAIIRPLRAEVNLHYAARLVERQLPGGGRTQVVNWIDLRDEKLPAAFRSGVNARAARGMQNADLEKAISARMAWVSAGLFAGMVLLFGLLFVLLGPRPFASLMGRAAAPFGSGGIASRTQVSIVRPGDAVVTAGTPVTIVAAVTGRVPDAAGRDAPALLYRHDEEEPYRRRPLARDEATGEWSATLGAQEVGGGFTYHVTAGDGRTQEHRITTRAAPLVSRFLVYYRYRRYVGKADRTSTSRRIDDYRGTEAALTMTANRTIKEARLEYDGGGGLPGTLKGKEAAFRFTLDKPGRYRLSYTTPEGESFRDADWSDIVVQPDQPPAVRITAPGKDITAPVNGTVEIEGAATDDFGIAKLELHLQVVGGEKLPVRPYMADKLGKPGFGTPRSLDYRAALPLAELGQKPGAVIEYWLEASDGCDFPGPQTAQSEKYKITLEGPGDAEARKKEQEAAKKREEQHKKEQEEKAKKEQAEKDEQRKKDEQAEKKAEQEREKEGKDGRGEKDSKENKNPKEDGKEGKGGQGTKGDDKKDAETEKTAKDLQDKLDNRDKKNTKKDEKPKGEGKGGGEKPGEAKPDEPKDPKEKPGQGKGAGEKGKEDGTGKPGEGKDSKPGEGDAAGKPPSDGEGKGGEAKPGAG